MEFWRTFTGWIKDNKEDISAAAVLSFTVTLVLCSFTFNTLAPQEGWYSIYARNILQGGLVPYRDFFLVVPPLHLYIWTFFQAILGDNFVVFHYLNILFQILFVTSLYALLRQVFNIKISVTVAFLYTMSRVLAEFDNGVISYNTLALIFISLAVLFTIKQVDFISTYKKINKKWLCLLCVIFALSVLNKQTAGVFLSMASVLILGGASYKYLGFNQTVKHCAYLFLGAVLIAFIILLPLIFTGALTPMIKTLFTGTSKGTPLLFLVKLFLAPFPLDLWPLYLIIIAFSVIMLPKSKNFKWEDIEDKKRIFPFLAVFSGIVAAVILITVNMKFSDYAFFYNLSHISEKIVYGGYRLAYYSSFLFSVILFFYLVPPKNRLTKNRLHLFIILAILLFINISDLLSNPFLFPQFLALTFGVLLACKLPKLNRVKNIIIFGFIGVLISLNYFYKLHNPMHFWGWHSGDVLGKLESSRIPRLKGMKIPAEEKQMYEEIYDIVRQYTDEDDKILAFNNNHIFYDLTERKPYTQYVSLYHDVSPDNQPLEVLENMKTDLPKVIVFLYLSDDIEKFHEDFYRSNISGQRILRDYIVQLLEEGKYEEVKTWKQYLSVRTEQLPAELLEKSRNMKEASFEERNEIFKELRKYSEMKNNFLQTNCILSVLVRKDLIQK